MNAVDIFTATLAFFAVCLIAWGIHTLCRRDLEMAALVGAYPLAWGIGIGALAAILFALQHISVHIV